jgi:hypothetical protein
MIETKETPQSTNVTLLMCFLMSMLLFSSCMHAEKDRDPQGSGTARYSRGDTINPPLFWRCFIPDGNVPSISLFRRRAEDGEAWPLAKKIQIRTPALPTRGLPSDVPYVPPFTYVRQADVHFPRFFFRVDEIIDGRIIRQARTKDDKTRTQFRP